VHVGELSDPVKPQLFRLEWPGLRDWDRSGIGFQSRGAGHPHWQIDLLESLHARPDRATFDPEPSEEVEDFDVEITPQPLSDRIRALTIERMHLASAAPWWLSNTAEFGQHHLNAPHSREDLLRWLTSAIVKGCRTPARARGKAAICTSLRAGVGQASREETAAHATVVVEGRDAMANGAARQG